MSARPAVLGCSPLPTAGSVDPCAPALVGADGTVVDHGTVRDRVDALVTRLPVATAGRLLVRVPLRATIEDVLGYLAVLEAGHVALVVPRDAHGERVARAWSPDLAVVGAQISADAAPTGSAPRHLLHPDLALLLSTSGSTGSPKLVRLSHDNVVANARGIAAGLELTAADRGITSLPLHYCYGLSVLHSHLLVGASVVLTEGSVLDADFWSLMDGYGVTDLAVVPHLVELMETTGVLEAPHPALRLITQAGGRMSPERVSRTVALGERFGWGLSVMYGQTESTARICIQDPRTTGRAPEAVGRPIPGTSVVLDPSVPEADPSNGTGEVVVRGRSVMLGYAEHPDDLALGRMITELRTGDLGQIDEAGVLRLVGRRSGFVKVLGLRIDLSRVERALERDGLVVCVTGDDEGVRVAVEPVDGQPVLDTAARARQVAARACGLGVGHVRVAVLALARLANGKVDRHGCDTLVRGSDPEECADARVRMGTPSLQVRVASALARVLGRDDIDLERSFTDQGGDSLSHVQASTKLIQLLGDLPTDWHHRPLAQLVDDATAPPPGQDSAPARGWARRLGGTIRIETSVVLRAVAVVIICGSHADLFRILGGAHILLVIAGVNSARFGLSAGTVSQRWRGTSRLIIGVAVPTMAVALLGLSYGRYGWDNVFLANWLVGDIAYGFHNELWFMDALVACVLLTAFALSVPAVARAWRKNPWRVAFALTLLGLLPRFLILTFAEGVLRGMMPTVFWLFAIGLALAHADTHRRRWLTLAAMAVGIAWFFPDDPIRNATVFAGVALLALRPSIAVPARLVPAVSLLAAASLHIYLIQFQIIGWVPTPLLATLAGLGAGILLWRWTDQPVRRLQHVLTARHTSTALCSTDTNSSNERIPS